MAEIADTGGGGKKDGKARSKKMSTKIDFTPMVDLGFLLITFFMLTTTLAKPTIMAIRMPDTDVPQDKAAEVKESQVLTLILGPEDKVYFYEEVKDAKLDSTDYSATGMRRVILDKMERVKAQWGMRTVVTDSTAGTTEEQSKLNVLIKPMKKARYKNIVDTFDEMKICNVKGYMMIPVAKQEEEFIANPAGGLNFSAAEQLQAAAGKQQ
jgi:biopolymer transport protein ExbD